MFQPGLRDKGRKDRLFGAQGKEGNKLPVLMEGRRFKLKKQRRSKVLERGAHVEISFGF